MKILVADDSRTNLAVLSASLDELGHLVLKAQSGEEAIELFKKDKPDLIILDVVMKGMSGFECAKQIRALDSEDWIPIIFLSGEVNDTSIAMGIDAGGDDYLTKPFSAITLAAKIRAMQRIVDMRKKLCDLSNKLSVLSRTDPLTGLNNRLQYDYSIGIIIAQAQRHGDNLALFFIDLDKFKQVNDTLGHQAGDLLLQQVAQRLNTAIRKNDFLARLGGDEFAIIMSRYEDSKAIETMAQKIIDLISAPYLLNQEQALIGASIGIAIYPEHASSVEDLIRKADAAMYSIKQTGRNNFLIYSEEVVSNSIKQA